MTLHHESFYRWYAEQGCPKINDDYSYSTRSIYDDPVLVCYHQYGICTATCPFPISHHDLFHPPQKSQPNRGVVKDLARRPRLPSVRNPTQTPPTRTASTV
jgi:hypothetical protein